MKKSIFLFFAAILCAMSVQGAASKQFNNQQFLYCIVENTNWNGWGIKYNWYWDSGSWCAEEDGTKISENHWYAKVPNEYIGGVQFIRCSKDLASKWDWSVTKNSDTRTDNNINCAKITGSDWGNAAVSWTTYAPPMSSVTLADNGTTVNSGTGTQADPYIIEIGTKIKVQASGTKAVDDPDAVINYAFKYGATSQDSETTTWEIDANSPSTTYAIELEGYTKVNTTSSEKKAATKLYYQTVADATLPTYQVTVTANDPAMGTVTGAGEYSEGATAELTATPNDGYKFVNWTVGSTEKSTNPTYSFTVTENVTLVANFQAIPEETVYFINTNEWTGTINAYAWTDGTPKVENAGWAGLAATKEDFQIGGYDVYSYTAKQGLYANVIFNGTGGQTTDLTWSDGVGKYYAPSKSKWYDTKEAAAEALAAPVEYDYVYFINTNSWAAVNIYTWNSEIATWPGVAMNKEAEQIAGFDVYSYKVVKGTSFGGMKFNEGQDKAQTGDLTWQAGKYYAPSTSEWYADAATAEAALAAVVTYDYYLTGSLVGGWEPKQQGIEKDGELYKATFNALAAGTYEFKITAGDWEHQWNYNNLGAAYEEVSQGVDGEGNPNGNIKIFTEEAKNITVVFDATAGKITFEGLTEKTINYVDIKLTITANSAPQIHYWGDGITGTDWNNLPSMTPTGNPNEYTFTIEDVDQEKGVNYLLKIGELQTADQSTKTDVVADFKDLLPLISIYGIVDWNAANAIHLTIADDYVTATANIELAAETTYEFKVNIGAKWLGNVSTMTSDNCTGWTFAEKNGEEDMPNAGITTTIAGEYAFTWNVADNKLSVTYPTPLPATYTRTVTSGNFGTICLPYAGTISNATLFVLSYKDENYVYVDEIGTTLEAGKPYLFLPTSDEIIVNYTDYTYENAGQNGALYGTYVEMDNAALMGKYIISGNKYYLINNATGNSRLPENRAYFVLDDVSPSEPVLAPGARRIALGTNGQNTATGMENVDASAQPVKTIINGQLFILRGEKMYDAQGKLVK